MSRILGVVAGVTVYELTDKTVFYQAAGTVDNDGSGGNPEGDKYHQDKTSYQPLGISLNAQTTPYIVVPALVVNRTKGIVMGCTGIATNTLNGKSVRCVCGDNSGDHLGEVSVAAAKLLGLNPSPVSGGVSSHVILYEIFPGVAAIAPNGSPYPLQPS